MTTGGEGFVTNLVGVTKGVGGINRVGVMILRVLVCKPLAFHTSRFFYAMIIFFLAKITIFLTLKLFKNIIIM